MKITNNEDHVQSQKGPKDLLRLPKNVVPLHYSLEFIFQLPNSHKYEGAVRISVKIIEPTDRIYLHSVQLSLVDASYESDNRTYRCKEIVFQERNGVICLIFDDKLTSDGCISLKFSGKIKKDSLSGIYENPYVNDKGEISSGICTLFAATEARSGFPCFDEPDFKATFDVVIICNPCFKTVLSNMPLINSTEENGLRKHIYHRTPIMSTYLLCMVIGHYDSATTTVFNTVVSVYTPLNRKEQGEFPLKVAVKCVEFYSSYFDIPYSLPKLDLIAVSRLSVGAMENWGLITCRESGLLVDHNHTAPSHEQNIASLVSHEICHQWFGNLVTMSWWSDLWLNEGLATFMQYLAITDLFPNYPAVPDQFCVNTSVPALRQDSLENSHPIRVSVNESSEISSAFDRITYCKGASIILMLHNFVGGETFKEGMRIYVKKHSFKNAETDDLWDCLSLATKGSVNVKKIMEEWTTVKGYPLLRVSSETSSNEENTMLSISQTPFSFSPKESSESDKTVWSIPMTIRTYSQTSGLKDQSILFDSQEVDVELNSLNLEKDPSAYVQVNPTFSGFFRTAYSSLLTTSLSRNASKIREPVGRLCLIVDRVSMIIADGGSTVKLLELISALREFETSFVVWQNICGFFYVLRTFFYDNSSVSLESDIFDRFCVYLMEPCLEKIQLRGRISDNNHPDSMLYSTLIGQMGIRGHTQTIEEVGRAMKSHLDGTSIITAGLRSSYFKVAASSGSVNFSQMLRLYRATDLVEEKNRILYGMGHFKDEDVLSRVLDFSLSEEVQLQESLVAICSICSNKVGYRLVWAFFTTHFDKFLARYGRGLCLMERLIKASTESFCTDTDLKEVDEFFLERKASLEGFERNIKQAKETIRLNITSRNRDFQAVKDFLLNWNNQREL